MPGSSVPCVIYAVKSSPDEKDAVSTQVRSCIDEIGRLGGRRLVREPFTEDNASGSRANRGPQLAAALAAAKAAAQGDGAELWVWHTSRLARGSGLRDAPRALGALLYDLRAAGVTVRSTSDDEFATNEMLWGFASRQAAKYAEDLSGWVRNGKDRQMEAGRRLGGPAPDGLRRVVTLDGKGRPHTHYERDENRAGIVERIFALSESGMGDPSIARTLNADGLRTQAGRSWTRRRVQDTLTNPAYAGRVVRYRGKPNEQVTDATNAPMLIDQARFDAIRASRATRDRSADGRERAAKGGRPTVRYAMSKLATCDRCGMPMYCLTSPYRRKDGTRARYYMCREVKDCTGDCDAPRVPAEAADDALVPHLRGFFCDFDSWLQRITAEECADHDALAAQLADLRTRLGALARQEMAAQDRWALALESDDARKISVLEAAMARLASEREQVAATATDLEATVAEANAVTAPVDRALDFWNALSDAIKGKLDGATTVAEVNAELREVLHEVRVNTLPDGRVRLLPIFADRNHWWSDEPSHSEADTPPYYPNTVPVTVGSSRPSETRRNSQAFSRFRKAALAVPPVVLDRRRASEPV